MRGFRWRDVGEQRKREREVEIAVRKWKPVLGRGLRAVGVVESVVDVGDLEAEVRMPGRDCLKAPPDVAPINVEALIGAAGKASRQRGGESTRTTSDVEDALVTAKPKLVVEDLHPSLADPLAVGIPARQPVTARRDQRIPITSEAIAHIKPCQQGPQCVPPPRTSDVRR